MFFKGIYHLLRHRRFFMRLWRANYRKLKEA
jgi:hypothetical protein